MSNKYCLNCGQVHGEVLSRIGTDDVYVPLPLWRKEKDYDGREYQIEVCKVARYENTISESKGSQTSTMD